MINAPTASRPLRTDRQAPPASDAGRVCLVRMLVVDVPLGPPLEHLVEGHAPFESSQRGAETKMKAVAEGQVAFLLAMDVEAVGIHEAALVAIRRSIEQQHDRALGNEPTMVLGIARHDATLNRRWRLEAQHLL